MLFTSNFTLHLFTIYQHNEEFIIASYLFLADLFTAHAQEFENMNPVRQQIHEKPISKLSQVDILEDTLVFLADSMYFSALDESRINGSYEFIRVFKSLVKNPAFIQCPAHQIQRKTENPRCAR